MNPFIEAGLIITAALLLSAIIMTWVKYLVDRDMDNVFTVMGPIIIVMWLIIGMSLTFQV